MRRHILSPEAIHQGRKKLNNSDVPRTNWALNNVILIPQVLDLSESLQNENSTTVCLLFSAHSNSSQISRPSPRSGTARTAESAKMADRLM